MNIKSRLLAGLVLTLPAVLLAQSPVSGFTKARGEGSLTVSYLTEKYNEVFFVPQKVDEVPVFKEVQLDIVTLYAEYGISDRLNIIVNLPYIKSTGEATPETLANNGFENERKGLQDLSVFGKYKLVSVSTEEGSIDFLGSAGVKFPLGNYKVNEGLQSIIAIGNRATDITGLGIAHYKNNNGLFITGQAGYSLKNNDIPNAVISELKVGFAAAKFYVDGYIANQFSDRDGVDILRDGFTGSFPLTRVNYTRVGLNGFVPIAKGAGISAGVNTYVAGRNLGKSTGVYGGLSFSF